MEGALVQTEGRTYARRQLIDAELELALLHSFPVLDCVNAEQARQSAL